MRGEVCMLEYSTGLLFCLWCRPVYTLPSPRQATLTVIHSIPKIEPKEETPTLT